MAATMTQFSNLDQAEGIPCEDRHETNFAPTATWWDEDFQEAVCEQHKGIRERASNRVAVTLQMRAAVR